jgi:hypothetical protein
MTHESVTTNVYDELDVIREAAQLLARRYSMIADALLESAGVFWEVIHEDRLTDWPKPLRTDITALAAELSADDDMPAHVEQLDSFQADALIGRVLDLRKAMNSVLAKELV